MANNNIEQSIYNKISKELNSTNQQMFNNQMQNTSKQPKFNARQESLNNNQIFNKQKGDNNNNDSDESIENVKQLGSVTDVNPVKDICFISIIGEIEGHTSLPPQSKTTKYEHIIPMIIGAEMDPEIKGILLLINTVGGDVEAGLAISELVSSISKPTVSLVLGGGHSIGTALAVSAKYSMIVPTGTMTIHPIRTNGFVIGVPQTFRYFQKMQERITNFIVNNSNVNRDALLQYMYDTDEIANDVGTVLNGDEVVDIGLINEIGGFSAAMSVLRNLIDNNEQQQNN
ncbi:ATP-dependent protease ClpP protease subunit [Sedimentibacter acidaminivorans]|jgi:ATP-dependent protease ClpP protease subunit|uniref:ATP-dependent protease ClpP protease subunit n=1 Tax=Sedimentibacter acidaminivorans TaxID=913099 RepID=A0ABS4GC89_9FIRM|nr:ATP-dependent protease ClpP protease subunit [Sedimentibacter acidaminivorans]